MSSHERHTQTIEQEEKIKDALNLFLQKILNL